jgi:hypothetical protein
VLGSESRLLGARMSWNDTEYFRKRAAVERAMASGSTEPSAVRAHTELAERYEALVREGHRPTLHLAAERAA